MTASPSNAPASVRGSGTPSSATSWLGRKMKKVLNVSEAAATSTNPVSMRPG
jgi:hypothetical protein